MLLHSTALNLSPEVRWQLLTCPDTVPADPKFLTVTYLLSAPSCTALSSPQLSSPGSSSDLERTEGFSPALVPLMTLCSFFTFLGFPAFPKAPLITSLQYPMEKPV